MSKIYNQATKAVDTFIKKGAEITYFRIEVLKDDVTTIYSSDRAVDKHLLLSMRHIIASKLMELEFGNE